MKGRRRESQAEGTGEKGRSLVVETDGGWSTEGEGRAGERGHGECQLDPRAQTSC